MRGAISLRPTTAGPSCSHLRFFPNRGVEARSDTLALRFFPDRGVEARRDALAFRFFPDRGVEARGDSLARFDCSFFTSCVPERRGITPSAEASGRRARVKTSPW